MTFEEWWETHWAWLNDWKRQDGLKEAPTTLYAKSVAHSAWKSANANSDDKIEQTK